MPKEGWCLTTSHRPREEPRTRPRLSTPALWVLREAVQQAEGAESELGGERWQVWAPARWLTGNHPLALGWGLGLRRGLSHMCGHAQVPCNLGLSFLLHLPKASARVLLVESVQASLHSEVLPAAPLSYL